MESFQIEISVLLLKEEIKKYLLNHQSLLARKITQITRALILFSLVTKKKKNDNISSTRPRVALYRRET